MIDVKNLHKYFGSLEVLKGIDCHIDKGECVCVIGPSGSGKSTFLRCLNLLETPTKGDIVIDDMHLTEKDFDVDAMRKRVGMVFQHFNLFPHLTILENVTLAPIRHKMMTEEQAKEKAMELLNRVGVGDKADNYPAQLSGGQKQRLAIARAIAKKAKVLVFDDSFSALDMMTDAALRKELNEKVQDASIVIVAQRVSTILHADQILVLDDGKIVGKGTHEELLKNCEVYLQIAKSQLSEKELGLEKLGLAEEKAEKETNKKEILSTKIDEKENNKLKKKSDDRKLKHKKGGK